MKKYFLILFLLTLVQSYAQTQQKIKLNNAVVVGMFDRKDERFQMEIMMAELLAQQGIKTKVSLNFVKEGAELTSFANDTVQEAIHKAGFDTYVLFSVRGYDTKFKPATIKYSLVDELKLGHLFPVFREEISYIVFEFKIYKNQEMIGYNLLKVPSPSNDGMIKKFKSKVTNLIKKNWI
jgi:hypothetical protein